MLVTTVILTAKMFSQVVNATKTLIDKETIHFQLVLFYGQWLAYLVTVQKRSNLDLSVIF